MGGESCCPLPSQVDGGVCPALRSVPAIEMWPQGGCMGLGWSGAGSHFRGELPRHHQGAEALGHGVPP